MAIPLPVVRHLLLCRDVQSDAQEPYQLDVMGFTGRLRVPANATGQVAVARLCALAMLTEVRHAGLVQIGLFLADTGKVAYLGRQHRVVAGSSPLALLPVLIRLPSFFLPHAGLYMVEFRYNGIGIAQEPLIVR
jgi:hypothetical protein